MKNDKKKERKNEIDYTSAENAVPGTPLINTEILSDVFGSYTGVPLDGGEPVQDADDL